MSIFLEPERNNIIGTNNSRTGYSVYCGTQHEGMCGEGHSWDWKASTKNRLIQLTLTFPHFIHMNLSTLTRKDIAVVIVRNLLKRQISPDGMLIGRGKC